MPEAWDNLDEIEATFAAMPAPSRLAMAAELLEWTVSNFATPIADPVVSDVVARAATAIREAVGRGAPAATGPEGFTSEIFEVADEAGERGAYELLLAHYLCFDALAPEIRPDRLASVFDQCYQADYRRYSEPAIVVGEPQGVSPREQAILSYQRSLISQYTA
jgi:hypothetical protein